MIHRGSGPVIWLWLGLGLGLGLAAAGCGLGCNDSADVLTAFPPERIPTPMVFPEMRPETQALAAELASFADPVPTDAEYAHRSWPKATSFAFSLNDSELLMLLEDPSPSVRALVVDTIVDRRPWLASAMRIRAGDQGVVGWRKNEKGSCIPYDSVTVQDLFYERLCQSAAPSVKALREAMAETNVRARCSAPDDSG